MELKKGIPVSPGIVIGEAFVLDTEEIRIPQRFVEKENVEDELTRFHEAIASARKSLDREIERIGGKIGISTQILEIHKQLLDDPVLKNEIITAIQENQYTAEHAVSKVLNRYIKKFKEMDSPIIQERVHDLFDIERLILNTLLGSRLETLQTLEKEVVVIAHNLTPAQTAKLDPEWVKGFATDVGGKTSHTAIMARSLRIPAVLALENISTTAVGGDVVIIDGFRGVVLVNPDPRTLKDYRTKEANAHRVHQRLLKETRLPSETIDGYPIEIQANIELPKEVHVAVDLGAEGVGLLRTEFIHMQLPRANEDSHFQHYRTVIRELGNRPVTIRTLDLGGDKMPNNSTHTKEENPFLGCRSIRYCLAHPEVFRAQLRAILRASSLGNVRMMLPMVTSIQELERSVLILDEMREELRREGIPFDEKMPVGVMVEVPSVAIIADLVASRVDFFSIGTNDLVQYALAVDRGNEQVAPLYDPVHPAILRLLVRILEAGNDAGIEVALCGEMGAEPLYIPLLIGLGLRHLSVSPQVIPEVKQVVRAIQVHEARQLAERCLGYADGIAITRELQRWGRESLPQVEHLW